MADSSMRFSTVFESTGRSGASPPSPSGIQGLSSHLGRASAHRQHSAGDLIPQRVSHVPRGRQRLSLGRERGPLPLRQLLGQAPLPPPRRGCSPGRALPDNGQGQRAPRRPGIRAHQLLPRDELRRLRPDPVPSLPPPDQDSR
eukprot:15573919-Heterocapsa_arctica.AAC.1